MKTRMMMRMSAVALALPLCGCQDLNSFVTGEKFLLAPAEAPRVEVEVRVDVAPRALAALADHERDALQQSFEDLTLSLADVGLRFYPVLDEAYGKGDDRPEHLMVVELVDLELKVDERLVEEEGVPARIEAELEGVACNVRARVEKRRQGGPALVVGTGTARGWSRNTDASDVGASEALGSLGLRRDAVGHDGLRLLERDLLEAFEDGTVDALRAVVKAIDRELARHGASSF